MSRVIAFAPLLGRAPRVLVLGSLPSVASLAANQYYAHPRNTFWRIMGELTGCPAGAAYAERSLAAERAGIAIWDVLAAASRPGSLDSAIDRRTIIINDFAALLRRRSTLQLIACNGQTASQLFDRHVQPSLRGRAATLARVTLPSTSPANASLSLDAKAALWCDVLRPALRNASG